MSRALRHDPGRLGLELDVGGWTLLDALVRGLDTPGDPVTRADVEDVVRHGSKQRYELEAQPSARRCASARKCAVPAVTS
jgi:putative RNA 2'-phosphotransferase